ncbi:MAG TPA: FmdB family zinc ribbon protein [Candidatus Dormibacteraeota bacterium]|nr:FmdB family zinc ribbon protein [Candidatus Dormibacteraeota bacterium]
MPIYGYRCSQCGHELEVFQSMSDQPLRVCPECSGALRKLLYPVGVHFKGSGFYTTDYKSGAGSASKNGSSASGESSGSEGSSEKKSESASKKTASSAAPSSE